MNHEPPTTISDPVIAASIIMGLIILAALILGIILIIKKFRNNGALLVLWNGSRTGFVDFVKIKNPDAQYVQLDKHPKYKNGPDITLDRKMAGYDRKQNRLVYCADPVSGLLYNIQPAEVDKTVPGWMDGRRLRGIRKDHRVAQLFAPFQEGWLSGLIQYTPYFMVVVILMLMILMGMLARGMGWL